MKIEFEIQISKINLERGVFWSFRRSAFFLNTKGPHFFKQFRIFFKQVRIFFKQVRIFFKHMVRIFFKQKVRILVPPQIDHQVKNSRT